MSTQFDHAYESFVKSLNESSQARDRKVMKKFHAYQEAEPEEHLNRNIVNYGF